VISITNKTLEKTNKEILFFNIISSIGLCYLTLNNGQILFASSVGLLLINLCSFKINLKNNLQISSLLGLAVIVANKNMFASQLFLLVMMFYMSDLRLTKENVIKSLLLLLVIIKTSNTVYIWEVLYVSSLLLLLALLILGKNQNKDYQPVNGLYVLCCMGMLSQETNEIARNIALIFLFFPFFVAKYHNQEMFKINYLSYAIALVLPLYQGNYWIYFGLFVVCDAFLNLYESQTFKKVSMINLISSVVLAVVLFGAIQWWTIVITASCSIFFIHKNMEREGHSFSRHDYFVFLTLLFLTLTGLVLNNKSILFLVVIISLLVFFIAEFFLKAYLRDSFVLKLYNKIDDKKIISAKIKISENKTKSADVLFGAYFLEIGRLPVLILTFILVFYMWLNKWN
jgi:hypothetical protein